MTTIHKLTDFIVRRHLDMDVKIDGYKLFDVLKEAFEVVETSQYVNLDLWASLTPEYRNRFEEDIKQEMYSRLGGIDNPENPEIVVESYALNKGREYGPFERKYSLTMLMLKKDLK